ncbi:MAG: thioredoxin family protein [Candidatus Omnitrophica bacterium]|nr:thioredoxin family protein [Candidatus Omnitrophota bacterium]
MKRKKTAHANRFPLEKVVLPAIIILILLMFIVKQKDNVSPQKAAVPDNTSDVSTENIVTENLPHLLELGSDNCIPCKMMRPILAELKAEHEGQLVVKFFDVYENSSIAESYSIRSIPTQIFLDAEGKEISRNMGFMPKDKILERWKSLGYEFTKKGKTQKAEH